MCRSALTNSLRRILGLRPLPCAIESKPPVRNRPAPAVRIARPTVPSWRELARHAGRVLGKPRRPAKVNGLKIRGIKVPDLHVDAIKARAREFRQATRCAFSALNVSSAWQAFRLAPAIPGLQALEPALLTPRLPPVDCSLRLTPQGDGRALSAATICRPCFWRGPAFSALAAQRTPFDC